MPRLAPVTSAVLPLRSNKASFFIATPESAGILSEHNKPKEVSAVEQKRVLITGAGSGLGRALAFRFAENGWRVACADIRLERAEATVKLITDFGVGAMALTGDV